MTARILAERIPASFEAFRQGSRGEAQSFLGRSLSDEEAAEVLLAGLSRLESKRARDVLESSEIENAVVIAGDDVGHYFASLPARTNITDVVSVVAPPFERFLVEFNGVANGLGLTSWGVLFVQEEPQYEEEGWLLRAILVGEWRRGKPVGPIVTWFLPLNRDGLLFEGDEEGYGTIFARAPELEDVPEEVAFDFADRLAALLGPALLTVSFLHCKNVHVRAVDPPPKLARKAEREHGRPLTRYHVLEIDPLRQVLDREGEAQTKGLRHALHICRGHFKTFTEEAPLFAKHVGTYWWPAQVRGSSAEGTVQKDYRIQLDEDRIGQTYRQADEDVSVAPANVKDDPDTSQRGLRAHNRTQNLLARCVEEAGFAPRSPKAGEPDFDLAWEEDGSIWVAEVKSTTELTEERQMRLAIGQVIRYRQQLSQSESHVRAMIALENAPFDESWIDLCDREGIALVWPEVMARALGAS